METHRKHSEVRVELIEMYIFFILIKLNPDLFVIFSDIDIMLIKLV